ncbi:MAG: outer membrane lipoprotein-sorting protein [Bacteroidales bacterium]|nr:outer membrane lipoprotein-sorting protein [Bacteroidales bacterium]MDD4209116.1 outer membrane lipoprotein-sorting protein [Bacteroidales bacterium]
MKKMTFSLLVSSVLLLAGTYVNAQDASTILKKMDNVMFSSKDMVGKQKVVLISKNGNKETRESTIKQKGTEKRLMRFTSPASQAGISVLSLPNDVMYLYLPAFGKERRIASSAKNQKFAGTDFSYDDMESKSYSNKYTPKLLKIETNVFVIELTPKASSDYSKLIIYINKVNFYPELIEYYDKGGKKVKEAKYIFKKVGNYWSATEIQMTDLKTNHKTKMQMSEVKYDTGLTDDEFSLRKLKD